MKYFVETEFRIAPAIQSPLSWPSNQTPGCKIVVLRPTGPRRRQFNWNLLLGMVTVVGISAASWTGLALLISRLAK